MEFDKGITSTFVLTLQEFLNIEDFNINYFTTDNQRTPNQIWFFLNVSVNGKGACYQNECSIFGKAVRFLCKIMRAKEKPGLFTFFELINRYNVGYINFVLDGYQNKINKTNFVCLDAYQIKENLDLIFSIESEPYFFETAIKILINDYNKANT